MRGKIIEQINSNTIDYKFLFEYYKNKGGNLPFHVFSKVFPVYSAGASIIDIFEKLIVEYEVNLLLDKNNRLIKVL